MRLLLVAVLLLGSPPAEAADVSADPSNYRNLLPTLGAGDRLVLAAGEYAGLPIDGMNGADGSPIVITGPESGAPAIITGRSCCNTISIRNSSYIVIRYLTVDVRGELVDGLKAEGDSTYAHHITVEHVDFFGFGQDQQIVGINTKCTSWDWIIRFNTIRDAGTGIYLGDSTGAQPFVEGIIEHNLVVNPLGYAMQIKHQNDRPQGPPAQAKTIIRHNVFIKAANASTGDLARPNLLIGHFPPTGDGASDRYEIYGNFLFENATGTEALFQGEGTFSFHDNVLVNTFGTGMYVQPQNGEVKDVAIYHNTFLVAGSAAEIYGGTGYTQTVAANAIFAPGSPLTGGDQRDNAVAASAAGWVGDPTPELGILDLYPANGMLSGAPVDLSAFAGDTDFDRDFNGTARDSTWRGAYHGSGTNPGWMLAEEIKRLMPGTNPTPDGGTPTDAGMIGGGDAGPPPGDGGIDPMDTGTSEPIDGAVPGKDASIVAPGSRGRASGGCGCTASQQDSSVVWVAFLLLACLAMRRVT